MDKSEIIKLIDERLKLCGLQVPIEETFDYSNCGNHDKCKLFIKLVNGSWRNSIYVRKSSNQYVSDNYYDLLFTIDNNGLPVCIPVPIAEKLFHECINKEDCRSVITGSVYEQIYKLYYEQGKLPI